MSSHRYQPASLEPKWQDYWLKHKTFRTLGPGEAGFDASKPKYYVLDMFPYPSGAGLHVGHPEGYTATDILARYKRMRGFNVMHPMGWDAFGLPAEQYAVQTGTHPSLTTRTNIENFRRQIQALGFSYDWEREISTTHPAYVRWTQWIFSLLYDTWFDTEQNKGRPIQELPIPEGLTPAQKRAYVDGKRLAYIDEMAVWWCSALGTVLANEEVIDGRSERGSHPCMRLPLRQWMLRITAYAGRLLRDLDQVDWPEETKKQQREWIGESQGAEVDFKVADGTDTIRVFTTRPDTLYGATFMVLAPEHGLVTKLTTRENAEAVHEYVLKTASKSELERSANKEKTGVPLGSFAINPVNGERIPIWISDYVLATYGTGAIMSVPGHDERDHEFAVQFGLPIVLVVQPPEPYDGVFTGDGTAINSPWIDGLPTAGAKAKIIEELEQRGLGKGKIQYRLRDWIFSRQRYWGEPFPIVHRQDGSTELVPDAQLPVELPELEDFRPSGNPEPLLAKAREWVHCKDSDGKDALRETNTMPNWAGSCWYYLRFIDPRNPEKPWDAEKEKYWMPVDLYVGGREHAVLHLLYARFWHKVLYDHGYVSTEEPFKKLFHQGLILAFSYEDEEKKLIPSDQVTEVEGGYVANGKPVRQVIAKMSKSLKNVINPDDILAEHGADAFRLYEMFMGPLDIAKPWNSKDVGGVTRFLQRVWRLIVDEETGELRPAGDQESLELERALHRCIKKVGDDIERMAFNTAVSAMMIFLNEASTQGASPLTRSQRERFVRVLAPFAPHMAEELWQRLGHAQTLAYEPWPDYEESMLVDDTIEVPVQVNGKLRAKLQVAPDITAADLEQMARQAVADWLEGKETKKVVVIPKRMVNLVV